MAVGRGSHEGVPAELRITEATALFASVFECCIDGQAVLRCCGLQGGPPQHINNIASA